MSILVRKKQAREKAAQEAKKHSVRRARPVMAALSLPEDVSEDGVRMILLGSRRALVENILGIADVGQNSIRLVARAGVLTFQGRALALTDVREGALAVSGQIEAVLLPGNMPEEARHD